MKKTIYIIITLIICDLFLFVIYLNVDWIAQVTHLGKPKQIYTGAVVRINPDSQNVTTVAKEEAALRSKMPMTTKGYKVSYRFDIQKFNVGLSKPYEESKQEFKTFLQKNGYELISADMFEYVLE
jgi:hypothetical protein